MSTETKTIIGYHGTTKNGAKSILETKSFNMSCGEEEWLGVGVYFFESDIQQAIDFCIKARNYGQWSVLYSTINAEKIVDLSDTITFNLFKKYASNLKNKYLVLKDGKPRKLMNSVVLNTMYKLNPYDAVRCIFTVPSTDCVPRTNIQPMQIQLAVRNRDCINKDDLKEVCNDGH